MATARKNHPAPANVPAITTTADSRLSAETNLGALASGLQWNDVAAGVATPRRAVAGTDYEPETFSGLWSGPAIRRALAALSNPDPATLIYLLGATPDFGQTASMSSGSTQGASTNLASARRVTAAQQAGSYALMYYAPLMLTLNARWYVEGAMKLQAAPTGTTISAGVGWAAATVNAILAGVGVSHNGAAFKFRSIGITTPLESTIAVDDAVHRLRCWFVPGAEYSGAGTFSIAVDNETPVSGSAAGLNTTAAGRYPCFAEMGSAGEAAPEAGFRRLLYVGAI